MIIPVNHPWLMQHPENPDNFILLRDYHYTEDGVDHVIPMGFVTDLASIPRIFWWIISPFELGDIGPIKHDWKYRNKIGTRSKADSEFVKDMVTDKIKAWKRKTAYSLLRVFGGSSWGGKVVIEQLQPA